MDRQLTDLTERRSRHTKSGRQAKLLTGIVSTRTGTSFVSLVSQMLPKVACRSDAAWTCHPETHNCKEPSLISLPLEGIKIVWAGHKRSPTSLSPLQSRELRCLFVITQCVFVLSCS